MRKIFILPMLMMAGVATASTTFYYDAGYDGTNGCPGWFLTPDATSCSEAVTKITPPTSSGKTFGGYWANGTKVIDSNGQIVLDTGAAPALFSNTDPNSATNKQASAAYTAPGNILVQTRHFWKDMSNGWYSCGTYGFHLCTENGDYIAPPATNCWATESWPCDSTGHNCNYDYLFNSYLMADGKRFTKPSSVNSWQNPYPNGLATGDGVLPGGCTSYYLDYDENDQSMHKIQAFACKRINNSDQWVDSVHIDSIHGTFRLNNDVAGTCRYELVCDDGYSLSNDGDSYKECFGSGCKGFFNGSPMTGITATCEKNTNLFEQ